LDDTVYNHPTCFNHAIYHVLKYMSDSTAISVDSLGKVYRDGFLFPKRFEALRDVTFEVKRGEIFGLLGPNGAGKTTFLKILLGVIRKTSGGATMMGFPAGSRAGRQCVGYLPEHLRIPPYMTGYTALECYGNLSNVPTRVIREKRGPLLDLVGLGSRGADRVKKYSKGMLQRLGLAQALLHDPRLLVLDEPTDGLDPRARAEMRQVIRDLKSQGVTVFLNSHILQEVELVCDRVAILHEGQLRYCGSVDEIGAFVSQYTSGPKGRTPITVRISGDSGDSGELLSRIESARGELSMEVVPAENDGSCLLKLSIGGQSELDGLIDRLRAGQISILGIHHERVSLEDAFLKIVDENTAPKHSPSSTP